MLRVIYALIPVLLAGIYFFGWRVLAILAVTQWAGFVTEYVMSRRRGAAVSTANFVTCWLLALSLPPTCPLWIAAVGAIVAVLFGKEVFGGFGRNFANPAIVGRTFLYVCFPTPMTAWFVPNFRGFPGGFAHWSFQTLDRLPDSLAASGRTLADAVTQATPMWIQKSNGIDTPLTDMISGSVSRVFEVGGRTEILAAGSIGEVARPFIILAAIYLIVTRTANWRLMLSFFLGIIGSALLFRYVFGGTDVASPWFWIFGGTTLYGGVFMVTDPVSSPNRNLARYAYGAIIGFFTALIRWKGVFAAGFSFAVLIGNMVAPLLDMAAGWWEARGKVAKARSAGSPTGGPSGGPR